MPFLFIVFMLIFSSGFTFLLSRSAMRSQRLRTKAVPRVKILTPADNPWGTTAELIAWAEARAVKEHKAEYSDPVTEELEKRFLAEFRNGGVTVLEDHDFSGGFLTPNESRAQAGYVRMGVWQVEAATAQSRQRSRWPRSSDSPELLNRARQEVLQQRYERFDETMRRLDRQMKALETQ